jgi:hypothetical protein
MDVEVTVTRGRGSGAAAADGTAGMVTDMAASATIAMSLFTDPSG